MKVGILTFHNAHNYGAVLQAFALRTYLRKNGFDAIILNYKNETISFKYKNKLPYEYRLKDFLHIRHIPKIVNSLIDTKTAQPEWRKQCDRFETFIKEILLEDSIEDLQKIDLERKTLDAFIAGSDQIWNHWLTNGIDPVYFLDFQTNARKIFYGASNGTDIVPKDQISYYQTTLSGAYAVSTREKGLAQNIEEVCGKEVYHVLDPTLLLDRSDYEQLITTLDDTEKFVFAYFVIEDDVMMEIAQYISRVLRIRLIELHYYKRRDLKGHEQRADLGPKEFLYYLDNAEFIVTNSFHGTVFSILLKKRFYSVYHSDPRKDELLKNLNLASRHINKCAEVDLNADIDYSKVELRLKELRKETEIYLKAALADR